MKIFVARSLLLAVSAVFLWCSSLRATAGVRDFELLSINSADLASGSGASVNPVVSTTGRYVAFASDASNLVTNDNNSARDIFWRDRVTGTTRLVSRTTAGASGDAESDSPVISADGRYVAFHSRAGNLVANDTNATFDVFLWDSNDDSVTLVSRTLTGASGAGDSYSPRLSANGRVVSFASQAADLVANDSNATADAFARDMDAGVTHLVSVSTGGTSANAASGVPVISADGRHVAFVSRALNLVALDVNALPDVFVRDLQTGQTRMVSVIPSGLNGGNRLSSDPSISADGRYIAFSSQATDLVGGISDTNNFPDVFVRDMQSGVTKLVSVNGSGTATGGNTGIASILPASFTPFISADGTKVLFASLAQDLVPNDSNGKQDVFLRDHINNTTTLISTNRFGTGSGNAASGLGANSMSSDLRYVAFFSEASDIGTADTNNKTDVFLRDLTTGTTKIISRVNLGGFAANGHSSQPVISGDGSTILFATEADNLDNRDSNLKSDVFAAATTLAAPTFGAVDVGVSITSVSDRTVGTPFDLTVTITNHSSNVVTGLVLDNTRPSILSHVSHSVSQGAIGSAGWVVGDLLANGTATATLTVVATNLGVGNYVVTVLRLDQIDTSSGNDTATTGITANRGALGGFFHFPGNLAYLSRGDSAFSAEILFGNSFTVENFERGTFAYAGVTATAGGVLPPSGVTDSVDADDGIQDGSGTNGYSYYVATNEVTFVFNPAVLGRLPTKVGIVVTDGHRTGAGFEVFGTNGVSLGRVGPFEIGDVPFTGETAEDRFIGVAFGGGISAFRVFHKSPGFELDHLQFDIPTTDLAMGGSAPAVVGFGTNFAVTMSVTNRGTVTATGIVVTNADPGSVQFVGAFATQGSFDTNGTWSVGTLAPGASASLTLTLTVDESGALDFEAGVSSAVSDSHTPNDTLTLSVLVPNSPPTVSFTTFTLNLLEDAAAVSLPGFVQASARETNQAVTNITVSVSNPALFNATPGVGANGLLTFTLAPNANGSSIVTVQARDSGGIANGGNNLGSNSFTVAVTPVNDPPVFGFATNVVVVVEDSPAQTVPGFIVSAGVGPLDESAVPQGLVGYTVTASSPAFFATGPAIANNGTLTFAPAPNASGSATITVVAQDDGGTANGGVNRSTNTFTINLTPVNDAPTLTFATNLVVVLEDAGAQSVVGFATSSAVELGQSVTNYEAKAADGTLFSAVPAVALNGTLTFTPAPNANGTTVVTVIAQDDGGTADGGVSRTTNTFTLTLTPVNDAPTLAFTTNNVVVVEDAGAQSIAGFATFSTGPASESGQIFTNLTITASVPMLFSVTPSFSGGSGTLIFTPAPDASGSSVVTVIVEDDGGTLNGGVNRTTNTFTITILPANDSPVVSFMQPSLTVDEDNGGVGAYGRVGFVTATVGPAGEDAGQTITNFTAVAANPALFSVQPAVALDGELTFTLAPNVSGSTTIAVVAEDDGGTANGGRNRGTNAFVLVIDPVNDAPTVTFATNNLQLFRDLGAQTVASFATLSIGPANEVGQAITNVSATAANTALFSVQPIVAVNGTLTFTTAAGVVGSSLVTVIAGDDGGTAHGGVNRVTNSFTITVTGSPPTTYTWLGGAGDWHDGTMWSPVGVPGAADSAIVTAGTVQITNAVTVGRVGLSGGTLTGAGDIVIPAGGQFGWTNGTLSGAGTLQISSAATMTFATANTKTLARSVTNAGTVTWTGGTVQGNNNPTFNILAGAVFEEAGGSVFFTTTDASVRTFNNAGTVRKTTASSPVWVGTFNNTGTIEVLAGNLLFTGDGGVLAGTITNAAGAALLWTSGAYQFSPGVVLTGAGSWAVNSSASLDAQAGVTVALPAQFVLNGGRMGGAGNFTVPAAAAFTWMSGTITTGGVFTVAVGGTMAITPTSTNTLGRTLNNSGTVTWTGGMLDATNNPTFNNLAGGVFEVQSTDFFFPASGGGFGTFNNAGTLRKTVSTGVTTWRGIFTSTGTVEVQAGTLRLSGGSGPLAGTVTTAAGATFQWTGGQYQFGSGVALTGDGSWELSGGNLDAPAGVSVTLPGTFALAGALGGEGSFTVPSGAGFTWISGQIGVGGAFTVASGGLLTFSGASVKTLSRQLNNSGTVTWTGGPVQASNSPSFNNLAGGVFDAQVNTNFFNAPDGGVATFNNAGTVRKTAGTGTTTWGGAFINAGTLEIRTGNFRLTNNYTAAAESALTVFLGGTTAGTEFGQLTVEGTNLNAGTLNIVLTNSFTPAVGNSFQVVEGLNFGSGAFSTINGRLLGGGLVLATNYAAGDLTLTAIVMNTAPTVVLATNHVVVLEDSGPAIVGPFATVTALGGAGEAAQSITNHLVTAADPTKFSNQPEILVGTGALTFTPAADASGSTVVTVISIDDGGTDNLGVNRTTNTFTVTITGVNDAPSFSMSTNNVVVLEDAGAVSVAGFIATSVAGPVSEPSVQAITNYSVTAADASLFAAGPAIALNGTLTFTPATNANGFTTVTVIAQDDGGTANSGVDKTTNSFTLTITAVNDAPTFTLTTNLLRDGLLQRSQSGIEASGLARRVVVDSYGNYVVAGESANGELETIDAVVIKYTAGGLPVWTNRFEVAGRGEVRDLALDPQGGVVLAAVSLTSGNENVVVIRYQADGGIIWSNRYEGGVGVPAAPNAVAVDSNGSVIVTGYRKDGVYKDFLTLRYSASGDLLWTNVTSSAETVGNDEALAVVVDSSGDVYVAGNGSDTDYTYGYVLKLDGTFGSAMWTNQLADPGFNQNGGFAAMALAANGDIVVGGHLQQAFKEFAVVRYSAAGAPAWTNLYQRTAADQQVRALRTSGNLVYVTGDTSNGTDSDFTTLMISSNGIPAWTNHYNGAGAMDADLPVALAVNSSGEVLVTGHSTRDGLKDIVTLKYTAAGGPVWTNRFNGVQMMNDEPFGLATGTAGEVYVAASVAGLPADSTSVFWTLRYGQLPAGGADQVIDTTMGTTFSLAGFIGSVSVGPANESVQALSYVVNNSNPGLFSGDPFIGASGLLTFAAAGTSAGVAVVTVRAQDDGGTANGGANQSAPLTFNITVTTGIVATAYTWVGGTGGGNWNNVTNWSPNGVPGPNDSATVSVIGAVEVTNATVVRNLTLEDVTLHGSGGIAVTTQFTWARGGELLGSGTFEVGPSATATWTGAGNKTIARRFENRGRLTWSDGVIPAKDAPVFVNHVGAEFLIETDTDFFPLTSGGAGTFTNRGTLSKRSGTGQTRWYGNLTHGSRDIVEVRQGVLALMNASYAPTASTTTRFYIGGLAAGTGHGQITSVAAGSYAGKLSVVLTNSFVPARGDTFLVVNSDGGAGTFSTTLGATLFGTNQFNLNYPTGDVELSVSMLFASLPPAPTPGIGGNGDRVIRWLASVGGYVLESAPAVTGPWTPVLTPVAQESGENVVHLPAGPTRFYRLVQPAAPRPDNNPNQ